MAGYGVHGGALDWGKLCDEGRLGEALHAVEAMEHRRIPVSVEVVHSLLKLCAVRKDPVVVRRVQSLMLRTGFDSVVVLCDHLIRLFASCGRLLEANQVFCRVAKPSVYTWNAIISANASLGHGEKALALYHKMQRSSVRSNKYIYISVLKACSKTADLGQGRLIHGQIIKSGLNSNLFIASSLIDMYAKCGSLEEARDVFNKLPNQNVVSWGAMITGYALHGHGFPALELFQKMQREGFEPDKVTFLSVLKACSSIQAIVQGRLIHGQVIQTGLAFDVAIGNALVDMYAKCGSLEEAFKVFDKLPNRDEVSWGTMIAGYVLHGHAMLALDLFKKMLQEGLKPAKVTFLSILKACGSIRAIQLGRLIHDQIIESGLESDVVVGTTLVDMFAKCGSLEEACRVFEKLQNRDAVSWAGMIAGYSLYGHGLPALELFQKMQLEGIEPDRVVFLSILKACGSIRAIEQGRMIHYQIIQCGFESDAAIGNALVDMYAKCESLEEASKEFHTLQNRDVISWGTMIAGYVMHGHAVIALELFQRMQQEGMKPNIVVFLSILKACGSIGAIKQGRQIHAQIIQSGLGSDMTIGNTLVDMYAKCGSIAEARIVLDSLPNRDVVSWSAMIAGYAWCGNCKQAVQCLEEMQQQGLKPVDMIFTSILSACSHAGLVDEGYRFFKSMVEDHGITPNICHYNCIVDLLGRAGCLIEAEDLLQAIQPDVIGWTSLLTACRTYGNVELGRRCFDQVVKLDPSSASGYVLMSNIYANACMWKDADEIEELRKRAGAWKKPGRTWIEVDNKVHEFVVGDKSHPQSDEINAKLKALSSQMKKDGYMPQLNLVLQQMSDKDKEDALCGHCEKLAIAFGLVSTPRGTIIQATKNLRVCTDCHNATKIISKIEQREIIIRDVYRVHYFKDGVCSCGDYY